VARLALVAVAAVLAAGCGSAPERAAEPVRYAPKWERITPGGKTRCARGGRYAFWIRHGDPKKLVVFFQGGGGCFDVRTCAPGSPWFDDAVDDADDPAFAGGIFALEDERNPFRDWSFVFVPSCTGDVHVGDAVARYGTTTIRHRGWQNARAALRRAFADFPDARNVLVTGCSAGSVGSAFHVPAVIARYPKARVTQLGDSLAFVFHRPVDLSGWGAPQHFPAFFRIGQRRFTMTEYVTALARRYPTRTFARFNYAQDAVQEQFYVAVGGRPGGFAPRLRTAERTLKRVPNYRSYLACGSSHCVLPRERFHDERVDGVLVRDWVAGLAAGRDVTCPTCAASG
jgi:hypothetical protein